MDYHFRNLVFEGGGIKGIAYVGALMELEKRGILQNINRVGGTSAGAITATLVALGYNNKEIYNVVNNMNFEDFFDDRWGIIRDIINLFKNFGWNRGKKFRDWIGELIKGKLGNSEATFYDLVKSEKNIKQLYIIGVNLSTGFAEIFSHEHTPNMCIADAVRISMSIPFIFFAIRSNNNCYCDGGLIDNYPVKLFDRMKYVEVPKNARFTDYYEEHNKSINDKNFSPYVYNKETLGFRLDSNKEIAVFKDHLEPAKTKINNLPDYTKAVMVALFNIQNSMHLHSDDWQRTIYIDTKGVKTLDFSLSGDKKQELITSGIDGVKRYFEWFDNPKENPVNR
ncbi:MAG: patatin-like phospholipase family protein [Proteobacteria bacterium]|nr:patatin-like phospholipase family protein [Pseudomonadota bacterium]